MNIQKQIDLYISSLPKSKSEDVRTLHNLIRNIKPPCTLWYLDGKNEVGKIVSNPNIGYGVRTIKYANGKSKDFYKVGLSANTVGISVYILGLDDKNYLKNTYGKQLGKAAITGYCIKFKCLKDIHIDVLIQAICDHLMEA